MLLINPEGLASCSAVDYGISHYGEAERKFRKKEKRIEIDEIALPCKEIFSPPTPDSECLTIHTNLRT